MKTIKIAINDYASFKDRLYIQDPETGKFIKADEWLKTASDPTTAEVVGIKTEFYMLALSKKFMPGNHHFDEAQEVAASFREGFRCPRRNESTVIYDAWNAGMKELFEKIGGDDLMRDWWTCEKDFWSFSRYSSGYFWCFYGPYGYLNGYGLSNAYRALPVRLYDANDSELYS